MGLGVRMTHVTMDQTFLWDPIFFQYKKFVGPKKFSDPKFFMPRISLGAKKFSGPIFFSLNFFWPKMNCNENHLWRDKTELLKLSKLPSAKVLLKLEFDTEDQVLFYLICNLTDITMILCNSQILKLLLCWNQRRLNCRVGFLLNAYSRFVNISTFVKKVCPRSYSTWRETRWRPRGTHTRGGRCCSSQYWGAGVATQSLEYDRKTRNMKLPYNQEVETEWL